MRLFDRIRNVFTNQEVCPPDHLEGYRRIGEEVYEAKVELANDTNPRVKLFVRVAETFQIMGNALLLDVFSDHAPNPSPVPEITHEQAEIWYGHIPNLLIAARKESVYPGSSKVALPIQIGQRIETPHTCPLSHLAGLRRVANELEELVAEDISRMRLDKSRYRETLLLYEEARTQRSTGDALVGSIMGGQLVPHDTHEDAKEQYWLALSNYLLVVQGIGDNSLLSALLSPKSKLDANDVWKVTARLALEDVRKSEEFESTRQELETFWDDHDISDEERQYESTVERLLNEGSIQENGYWYRVPFQPVYVVIATQVQVHHQSILKGHEFVWDYSNSKRGDGFLTRSAFRYTTERSR